MAYSSRMRDIDNQNEVRQRYPAISQLVKPSNNYYTNQRPNDYRYPSESTRPTEYPYGSSRPNDYRYPSESTRPTEYPYGSTRPRDDDKYSIGQLVRPRPIREDVYQPSSCCEYSKPVPTANIIADPIRRPYYGNARPGNLNISIKVNVGGSNRPAQVSYVTNDYASKPPAIRSAATFDNVHYLDLNFQSPQQTARVTTDGILRSTPLQNSTGFPRETSY
ncbi:unnamed protein product [Rotaria sp. Silwood1]|nr:unnamed protein product [Rotaria sp. Silwood1]CAF5127565.1 unnamed protein product [Rotaria sp. Silwood1]